MNHIKFDGFDWDGGNREKCRKHGLSKEEIELFFTEGKIFITPDLKHSSSETRFLAIGAISDQRPIFVAFTMRKKEGSRLIRPISARYMHKKEWEKYEQNITDN